MPEDLATAIREHTGPGGFSRYVAEAAERQLKSEEFRELLDELEAEFGPVPPELRRAGERQWLSVQRGGVDGTLVLDAQGIVRLAEADKGVIAWARGPTRWATTSSRRRPRWPRCFAAAPGMRGSIAYSGASPWSRSTRTWAARPENFSARPACPVIAARWTRCSRRWRSRSDGRSSCSPATRTTWPASPRNRTGGSVSASRSSRCSRLACSPEWANSPVNAGSVVSLTCWKHPLMRHPETNWNKFVGIACASAPSRLILTRAARLRVADTITHEAARTLDDTSF